MCKEKLGEKFEEIFSDLYHGFSKVDKWKFFEDVKPVILSLKAKGVKMGVISNNDDRLLELLKEANLSGYFEFVLVSAELGFMKPQQVFLPSSSFFFEGI